ERDDRRALGLRPAQHGLDLGLLAREGDQVRRVLELASEAAHHVPIGLPERVRRPLVLLVGEQVAECRGPLQPPPAPLDLLQRNRLLDLTPKPEVSPDPFPGLAHLRRAQRLILVPPPPVLQPTGRHSPTLTQRGSPFGRYPSQKTAAPP